MDIRLLAEHFSLHQDLRPVAAEAVKRYAACWDPERGPQRTPEQVVGQMLVEGCLAVRDVEDACRACQAFAKHVHEQMNQSIGTHRPGKDPIAASSSWTIEDAVNLWLDFVAEGKASTARAYRTDFEKRFLPFCKSEGLVYLDDLLRPGVASRFAAYLDQQRNGGLPLSANTRQRSKASVKSFARWCVTEGLLPRDFARVLTLPKRHRVARRPPTILTPQQYDRLEAAIDLSSPWGLRDRAILALTYATGCRSHEARWMQRYHVRDYRQDVMLLDLKTGQWKAVPVEGWVMERLLAWIEAANLGPLDYLWPSRQAPVLSRKGWWDVIHRIGSRAGMPYLRPHDFRHTLREDAKEAGASLESLAALTGTSVVTLAEHYGRRQRPADPHEAAELIHEFRRWRRLQGELAALWPRAGQLGA